MFARKPATVPSAPAPAATGWMALAANPYVGAGAAALLLLLAAGALIAIAGDPHAGAPSVRVALAPPSKTDLNALHQNAALSLDNLKNGQEIPAPDASADQALITLPQGATVSGGSSTLEPAPDTTAGPPKPQSPPLPVAPLAGLSAQGPGGLLPVIGKDGRTPAQAYARPFHDNGKPKIALVVGGLGLNAAATKSAIERLPPDVTLSFVPYSDNLQGWIDLARANGHEVLLEIPMEPIDYPTNDPGPYTLMASASPPDTIKRLDWLLSRASGYFGVANYLGGRFLASDSAMVPFTNALKGRGLAFVDDGSAGHRGGGPPRASADAVVDQQLSADAISQSLLGLEAKALQHGSALGSGFAYPVTVEQVIHWAGGLPGRGYQLAPASAITRR
ncbi:divergent polysaccharide deacetylase family protein [Caulobacter sp. S45]|uniref:divergent polysaccharide deacetylase family protein n=1 Tax=Caulobacter sp. S45 TaxID=1641861 RepID=UPI00131DF3FC|nr:divergent polysaccharide deacetylase family protein [Caulobacter sp. S45]